MSLLHFAQMARGQAVEASYTTPAARRQSLREQYPPSEVMKDQIHLTGKKHGWGEDFAVEEMIVKGEFEKAETAWRALIERFPKNPAIYENYAQILVRRDRIKEAKEVIQNGLSRFPKQVELRILQTFISRMETAPWQEWSHLQSELNFSLIEWSNIVSDYERPPVFQKIACGIGVVLMGAMALIGFWLFSRKTGFSYSVGGPMLLVAGSILMQGFNTRNRTVVIIYSIIASGILTATFFEVFWRNATVISGVRIQRVREILFGLVEKHFGQFPVERTDRFSWQYWRRFKAIDLPKSDGTWRFCAGLARTTLLLPGQTGKDPRAAQLLEDFKESISRERLETTTHFWLGIVLVVVGLLGSVILTCLFFTI